MKFEELDFRPHPSTMGGVRATHDFPNGYGVSVIRTPFSYGGREGLYELAVMKGGRITYETPITDDVIGNLTPEGVARLLREVEALPTSRATE